LKEKKLVEYPENKNLSFLEACNELTVPIIKSKRQSNTATCIDVQEGNSLRFELKTSHTPGTLTVWPSKRWRALVYNPAPCSGGGVSLRNN